jgi:hypothetical protein
MVQIHLGKEVVMWDDWAIPKDLEKKIELEKMAKRIAEIIRKEEIDKEEKNDRLWKGPSDWG